VRGTAARADRGGLVQLAARRARLDLAFRPPYRPDMHRRRFLLTSLAGALAAPLAAEAQQAGKVYRVGVLDPGRLPGGACVPGFREGLRQLGYIEGQTIVVDLRFAGDDPGRIPVLAAELVRKAPDLLWTHSPQGAIGVAQATATIPIVVGVAGFLVEQGLAASLARPRPLARGILRIPRIVS
jgi:ABC-type uncharacterized transport system substrate-binding protein